MIGDSDKPFIPKQESYGIEEYKQNKSEWAASNYNYVYASNVVGSTTTLYTVPENKTLYITSSFCSAIKQGVLAGVTGGYLQINSDPNILLNGVLIQQQYDHDSQSGSYPMPIVANSGAIIQIVVVAANTAVLAGFHGYLE